MGHSAILAQLVIVLTFLYGGLTPALASPAAAPYDGPDLLKIYDGYAPLVPSTDESYADFLARQHAVLAERGFRPWRWNPSGEATECANCALSIVPVSLVIETPEVYAFLHTLESEKFEILKLYPEASAEEYNLLAQMAVGILRAETKSFRSSLYQTKEAFPAFVATAKIVKSYLAYYARSLRRRWNSQNLSAAEREKAEKDHPRLTANSRGPTQIKNLPLPIAARYGVTAASLSRPRDAAVATMGYLLEALAELKRRKHSDNLTYVNESNYIDYLPYIYFGSRWQLMWNTHSGAPKIAAEPSRNRYISEMKRGMSAVEVFEGPRSPVP